VAMIEWHEGEDTAPRDRRLLLIAVPEPGGTDPDIVIGHWHEAREVFVQVEPPCERGGARSTLNVKWWAEIPDLPHGVELRKMVVEDWKA
jgi:hypothetical protein